MSLEEIETVAAEESKAPRVSLQDIKDNIVGKYFARGDSLIEGEELRGTESALSLLTICVVVTKSGFTVVGTSACVSPENFNKELGEKIAYENCIEQLWPVMGYALRERLAGTT